MAHRESWKSSQCSNWLVVSLSWPVQKAELRRKRKKKGRKKKEKCGVCVSHARKSMILVTKGSAQPHSEMHQDHVHHLGPHLNFYPKLWNNIYLEEGCQD